MSAKSGKTMARKTTKKLTDATSRLDEEPYSSMLSRMRDKARRALESYGDPKVSLEELREATASMKVSLSEKVLSERQAGW